MSTPDRTGHDHWGMLFRTPVLTRVAEHFQEQYHADFGEEIPAECVLIRGIALALTNPEWALAALADEDCTVGDCFAPWEMAHGYADGIPEQFPIALHGAGG